MMLLKITRYTTLFLVHITLATLFLLAALYFYALIILPDVQHLNEKQLQAPLQVLSQEGELIAEFGQKRFHFIPYAAVPPLLIKALLATEDQRFFDHNGIDIIGLIRAAKSLLLTGRKTQGASTITMQVARNFFLSRDKTFVRKFNEILLAIKIDNALKKEKILELYLNKIFLGHRAYGVAAAAKTYYGKSLPALSLAETAMIAGLPQAPSRNNPLTNPRGAKRRRNHVLLRMYEKGFIQQHDYQLAIAAPITAKLHETLPRVAADYIAEMVRISLYRYYGDRIYTEGIRVYTTVQKHKQHAANLAVRNGLIRYSKQHGFIGPIAHFSEAMLADSTENATAQAQVYTKWQKKLGTFPIIQNLVPAVVTTVRPHTADVLMASGQWATLHWDGLRWASRRLKAGRYKGPAPQQVSDILQRGDVVHIQYHTRTQTWSLSQLPQIQTSLVSIQPQTGAILALVGGLSYKKSHFNRATQALRQCGSTFKPFIFSAALEKGYTLASLVDDAPIVMPDSGENTLWRPQNYQHVFFGPTRLKIALAQSINLISIRLLREVGMAAALSHLKRFGFTDKALPHSLSLALGSGLVSPLKLTSAYAVFANGGYAVSPYLIARIENTQGDRLYQHHATRKKPVISPQIAYLITNALHEEIESGTGQDAKILKRTDLSGKTGTTNHRTDGWFVGYNADVLTTVWVGFDDMRPTYAYGRQSALPIWIDYMRAALQHAPHHALPPPAGIVSVRIDPDSGLLARPEQKNAIFEVFRKGHLPTKQAKKTLAQPADPTAMYTASPAPTTQPTQGDNDPQKLF